MVGTVSATPVQHFLTNHIHGRIVLKNIPLSMLILGQKSCFLGPTIFKIPQPNWYYCVHGRCQSCLQSWWNEKWQNESDNTIPFLTKKENKENYIPAKSLKINLKNINKYKEKVSLLTLDSWLFYSTIDFHNNICIAILWKLYCIL